jgi:hypothetical protein
MGFESIQQNFPKEYEEFLEIEKKELEEIERQKEILRENRFRKFLDKKKEEENEYYFRHIHIDKKIVFVIYKKKYYYNDFILKSNEKEIIVYCEKNCNINSIETFFKD